MLEVRHCAVGDDDLPLGSWRRVLVFFMVLFGTVLKLFLCFLAEFADVLLGCLDFQTFCISCLRVVRKLLGFAVVRGLGFRG